MTSLICNAPFCENSRNYNHAWCPSHRWEREKYKVKHFKELLPLWAVKRCKKHGLLRASQTYYHPTQKGYRCLQCVPAYDSEVQKKYTGRYVEYRRNHRLKARYKITIQQYEVLLKSQNNCCAICKVHIDEHKKRKGEKNNFAVDHCHETNKIRGLLCYKCNMGLGYFNDSIEKLETALNYLRLNK